MLGLASLLAAAPDPRRSRSALERLVAEARRRVTSSQAHRRLALVRADADLRQRASAARAVRRATRVTGDRASLRVARESLEFLEDVCFRRRSPGAGRQRRLAQPRRREAGGRRASDRRRGVRARVPRRLLGRPATTTTCAACASRSPGSWAPTGSVCRSTTSRPPAAATAWAWRDVNLNQGAESTISFLLSLLEMLELAGEGLEYADDAPTATQSTMTSIDPITRTAHRLLPDPRRVIAKPYLARRGDRCCRARRARAC